VRLTNDLGNSVTSLNNARSVAASGTVVHVAWTDNRDGNEEIYYKRSVDGGLNWEADTRLTNNSANSADPSLWVTGSVVHVVWNDNRDGNYEIYYKFSADGGVSWGTDTRLTDNSADSKYPSVSESGSTVHVVWQDDRDGGEDEIYYKSSIDGGSNWGADTRLTNNEAVSEYPSISVSGAVVHVAWEDRRDGNYEIYYKRSSNGGVSWGADTRLTDNYSFSYLSGMSVSGQSVNIVWQDDRDGNYEIYYKRSTDGGSTWETDTRLTNDAANSYIPSVSASGSDVHIVWRDQRDGNDEIYYNHSTDGGSTWGIDTRLSNNGAFSYRPSVSASGLTVHVVWEDLRDGNPEIYYKCYPAGNVTGLGNIDRNFPEELSLLQNYPNPFTETTTISWQLHKKAQVVLKVYDFTGREVKTLVQGEYIKGEYKVIFDASGFLTGVYFYQLKANGKTEAMKMIISK
jgi:hypothetical protein